MKLNFPDFSLQIKTEKNKNYVFDIIRKKYVVLSPEEWVRQHLIHYLISLDYPSALISVERSLPNSSKRYDLVVFNREGSPFLIAECKSPSISLDQKVSNQISAYLMKLPAPYFIISNGLIHLFYARNPNGLENYQQIPKFSTLSH